MKYLVITYIIVIMFSGCNSEKEKRYMMAIKACEKQNGVPMLNGFGRMTECKFNKFKYSTQSSMK